MRLATISILIPVFNQIHFTKQVLKSIEENISNKIDYEIIILDNGSTDGTGEYLRDIKNDKLKTIDLEENIIVNPAWNMLAKKATGDYLIFLNNDITLFQDFDLKMVSNYTKGKIVCPSTCQHGESTWHRQGENINGTCFLVKKEDYVEIPNELKCWWGDDYLFRSLGVNWVNDEWVVHWGSQTLNKLPEVNEIIENDRKAWIKICLGKGWQDTRFPETLITTNNQ